MFYVFDWFISSHRHTLISLRFCTLACILASSYPCLCILASILAFLYLCNFMFICPCWHPCVCLLVPLHPHILRFISASLHTRIVASLYPQIHVCLLVSSHPHILVSLGSCVLVSMLTASGQCLLDTNE